MLKQGPGDPLPLKGSVLFLGPPSPTRRAFRGTMPGAAPSLLTHLRVAIRTRHYSPRTEEAYVQWVRRFIRFCGLRHPHELGPSDVTRFLSSLAVDANVSASTQNQALAAIVFLYRDVLNMPVGWLNALVRAKRPGRVPVVFTRDEVRKLFAQLQGRGAPTLVIELLYGSGMRLVEALQLRIKDVGFGGNEITVGGGKGDRDRRDVAGARAGRVAAASGRGARAARARRGGGGGVGRAARGARVEVHECGPRVGLAVGVSRWAGVRGSCDSPTPAPPSARDGRPARVQGSAAGEPDRQGRQLSHAAAFLRNSPARSRLRYPNRPRAVGPPQRRDDDDLHARAEPRGTGCEEPCRHAVINRLG